MGYPLRSVCLYAMQTDKVRQEFKEDMSISRAFSMVFDRRPDLRFDERNNVLIGFVISL